MNHDEKVQLLKILAVWFTVGVSQMTPLQWVQFFAAIAATVYSGVQTYFLLRDRWLKRKQKRGGA